MIRAVSSATHKILLVFFFQAEDGIRDATVTGVQTCALPIWSPGPPAGVAPPPRPAATRSARPAPPPPPAAPRPAPSAPRSGQPAPHTRAAPDAASLNPTMVTKRTPAPTRRRSTGGRDWLHPLHEAITAGQETPSET